MRRLSLPNPTTRRQIKCQDTVGWTQDDFKVAALSYALPCGGLWLLPKVRLYSSRITSQRSVTGVTPLLTETRIMQGADHAQALTGVSEQHATAAEAGSEPAEERCHRD